MGLYSGTTGRVRPVLKRDETAEPHPADTSWIDQIDAAIEPEAPPEPRDFAGPAEARAMKARANAGPQSIRASRDAYRNAPTGDAPESLRRDDMTPMARPSPDPLATSVRGSPERNAMLDGLTTSGDMGLEAVFEKYGASGAPVSAETERLLDVNRASTAPAASAKPSIREQYERTGERTAPYQMYGVPDPKPDFDEQTLGGVYPLPNEPEAPAAPTPTATKPTPVVAPLPKATPKAATPTAPADVTRPSDEMGVMSDNLTTRGSAPVPVPPPVAGATETSLRDRLTAALAERNRRSGVGGLAGIFNRAAEGVNAAVGHRKADYSFGNALDAKEQAWRDQPVLEARVAMAADDKAKADARQAAMDDLNRRLRESEIAKNKQVKPALSQAQLDAESAAKIRRLNAQAAAAGRPSVVVAGGGGGMNDAIEFAAQAVAAGRNVPLGRDPNFRNAVFARAKQVAEGAGATAPGLAAGYKADSGSLSQSEKRAAAIAATIGAAKNAAQFVLNNSESLDRMTGVPAIEERVTTGRSEWLGDPNAQKFTASIETLANEYARIMSMSPTGAGQSTDSQKQHVRALIHAGLTKEQIRQAVGQIVAEMDAAERATADENAYLRSRVGAAPSPSRGGGAPTAPQPTASTEAATVRMRAPDGTLEDVPAASVAAAEADGYKRI